MLIQKILIGFFSNFGFVMFVLALLIALLTYKSSARTFWEQCFRWVALLPIGINGIYNFVLHGFFGDMTAAAIGWQNSPFQFEVAVANLGFGLIGLFAFKATLGFRKAVVLANACWLWGDAAGHIYQMITQHNFASGNAGSWFWLDVLCPLVLLVCIIKMSRAQKI